MKLPNLPFSFLILLLIFGANACQEGGSNISNNQSHPNLILTTAGVDKIKSQLGSIPKFDATVAATKAEVDAAIEEGIDVPIPKDMAGGYSHEVHKKNFFILQKAGALFQITGDEKYAIYVRDMFLEYADLYPTLDRHPQPRSYARGKLFWQCLNDANWLVYSSQAYDCIYDWVDAETREKLNNDLFRPMADFLSVETPQFFNRIHNHSTWGNAAVGMIGLVIDDDELVNRALYGLDSVFIADFIKDNDGGNIRLPDQDDAGFLAQIDHSLSPDGYYTEGPYYQRYAMSPYLLFAQALANAKPEMKILEYKDGALIKAVYALLDQTNTAGEFFPINDAVKGMSVLSRELITAVSLAYHFDGEKAGLLPYLNLQERVPLNETGVTAAIGLRTFDQNAPIKRQSIELSDGANGDEGALGIIRAGADNEEQCIVMKYTKQGMGHGHFDKLSYLYYHDEKEVLQDYGSARWVNIEQKNGGGYLKENKTWAKQTVAHNTVVINGRSQYDANTQEADKYHSDPYLFEVNNQEIQVMSAKENNAYTDIAMQRTVAMIQHEELQKPLVLDIFRIDAAEENEYDLPFYYLGDVLTTNFPYKNELELKPMGEKFGYQHLWQEATGKSEESISQMSWFNGKTFYSLTTESTANDNLIFTRLGANDSEYHLKRIPGFLIRRSNTAATTFTSTLEVHGDYSPVSEIAVNSYSSVKNIITLRSDSEYSVGEVELVSGTKVLFAISNADASINSNHSVAISGKKIEWKGAFYLNRNN